MSVHFYLVRHPKVIGESALYGKTDVQAQSVGERSLTSIVPDVSSYGVFSSPLKRCSALAERIALAANQPLQVLPNIAEINFGDWDGIPFSELQSQWSILECFWREPAENTLPNAESLAAFSERVTDGLEQLKQTEHRHNIVVTHGGVIRMLIALALNMDWRNPALYSSLSIANLSLTHLEWLPEYQTIKVHSVGVIKHG